MKCVYYFRHIKPTIESDACRLILCMAIRLSFTLVISTCLLVVNVSFVEASVTVGEGVCAVIVTLEKTGSAVGPVSVRLYTINDTAKGE